MRRRLLALLVLTAALATGVSVSGCGSDGANQVRDDARARLDRARTTADDVRQRARNVRKQIRDARANAERVGARLARRVREVLDRLRKAVPTAGPATRPPSASGRTDRGTIDGFLTEVLRDVDGYWTRTLTASGLEAPRISYDWVPPGDRVATGCGTPADDRAAFYCPRDDTIYVGQVMAAEVYRGAARGFPGEQGGEGHAVGDFGVAYIVAHEYAHDIQQELGFFTAGQGGGAVKPFELQADCMAGLWGNSVYRAGRLRPGDVEEALSTALAVGDFDRGMQHHGTPGERQDAWRLGFESGDPKVCRHFVAG
jgi:hypothetical protein